MKAGTRASGATCGVGPGELLAASDPAPRPKVQRQLTLIVFSGDFDRWMAAFTMATSAAAAGAQVVMYFTFWGILGLRRRRELRGKSLLDRMFSLVLPRGVARTSRMNMLGFGPRLFGFAMRKKKVVELEGLVELARELGVRFVACEMSMDVMGVRLEELAPGVEVGGATTCVAGLFQPDGASLFV